MTSVEMLLAILGDGGEMSAEQRKAADRVIFGEQTEKAADWIGSPNDLCEWLIEHPKATATIWRWGLSLTSPDVQDVLGFESHDPPSECISAVESFCTNKDPDRDGFIVSWSFS